MTSKKSLIPRALPPYFRDMLESDQKILLDTGRIESYRKNELIKKEGVHSNKWFIINSGYCALQIQGRIVGIIGPTDSHGPTLLRPKPHIASLRALSTVVTLTLDVTVITELWGRNPLTSLKFMDLAIERVQRHLLYSYALGVIVPEVRLVAVLWFLGEPQLDGSRLVPPVFTQDLLANMLRLSREEINKKRKLLITSGYLFKDGTSWYLTGMTPMLLRASD